MISAKRKISFGVLLAVLALVAVSPARADDTPTFVTDPASHCSLGVYKPAPNLIVRWNGTCVAGKAEGQGIAEWQGQYSVHLEGVFHAGLLEGRGLYLTNGGRYEAEFRNGRMNGRCVMVSADIRIDGECVDDQFNGPVKIVYADGGRYEGDFKNGRFNGQGIFYRKDGTRFEGLWVNHSLNGKGRAVYANGDRYEGDFVDGNMEGTGKYYFASGNVYEGEWTHDLPNGRGVFHNTTHGLMGTFHRDFAGTWVNGCFAQDIYTAHLFKTAAQCGFNDD